MSSATGTAIATKAETKKFIDLLSSEPIKAALKRRLPPHLTADRMVALALSELARNAGLRKCTPMSVASELQKAAEVGLEVGGMLGSGYLVPFKNKETGQFEAKFIPGYRGLIDLARRSGQVKKIEARLVWEDDEFDMLYGSKPEIIHRPSISAERGQLLGAYMVATLEDGTTQHEFMTDAELETVRSRSRSRDNGPWVTDPLEMKRKTVVRRGVKYLPLSPDRAKDLARALELDNQAEGVDDDGVIIDAPAFESTDAEIVQGDAGKPAEEPKAVGPSSDLAQAAEKIEAKKAKRQKQASLPVDPPHPDDRFEGAGETAPTKPLLCIVDQGCPAKEHDQACPQWIPKNEGA